MTGRGSRERILARIRAATAGLPPVPDAAGPPPAPRERTEAEIVRTAELFAARVRDYRATVHLVAPGGVPAAVAGALAGRGARRVVRPGGLPVEWPAGDGVEFLADEPPLTAAELDAADGVLTGCAAAVAETGTIVLDAGAGQGRRALTLLPDYHLCVVRAGQIVPGVPEVLGRLDPARPLTWISGPSATSDIELDRVEGVHGPRTLEVIVELPAV
ncbi:hypothetical protein Sru01_40130 [Sphaerisporangium rufum]|uniref:LUD domain-containing protein n=1 Tax=Sphaerisporangium rufum TaxID=1381558 RepID=A0A919UZF0_9ACTN|nr:LUD domain-containing protein [Sphaerisporangium rufum]GII79031.1 hypothetical protein Sru01_40130 [Sphaerisporangium rufum]